MKYLMAVFGLTSMSPRYTGQAWQDKLGELIEMLPTAISQVPEAETGPEGVYVHLAPDLYDGKQSSTIVVKVDMADGKPLPAEAERAIRRRIHQVMRTFYQTTGLTIMSTEIMFSPKNTGE